MTLQLNGYSQPVSGCDPTPNNCFAVYQKELVPPDTSKFPPLLNAFRNSPQEAYLIRLNERFKNVIDQP